MVELYCWILGTCIKYFNFVDIKWYEATQATLVNLFYLILQLTKAWSEGDVPKGKKGFYGFTTKPGKAAKVVSRLVVARKLFQRRSLLKGHCHRDLAVLWRKLWKYLTKNLFSTTKLLLGHVYMEKSCPG